MGKLPPPLLLSLPSARGALLPLSLSSAAARASLAPCRLAVPSMPLPVPGGQHAANHTTHGAYVWPVLGSTQHATIHKGHVGHLFGSTHHTANLTRGMWGICLGVRITQRATQWVCSQSKGPRGQASQGTEHSQGRRGRRCSSAARPAPPSNVRGEKALAHLHMYHFAHRAVHTVWAMPAWPKRSSAGALNTRHQRTNVACLFSVLSLPPVALLMYRRHL